jgi:hypothetical protein
VSNIDVDSIVPQSIPFIQNNSHDWIAPTLFYAASLVSGNPDIISVSLGVIGNYVTEMFKGMGNNPAVTLSIVVEKPNGKCTKIDYKGRAEGIIEVTRLVQEASRD